MSLIRLHLNRFGHIELSFVSGSAAAEKIQGLTGFKPVVLGPQDMDLSAGALRHMGVMSSLGIRVLVNPSTRRTGV